jgi:tetratricopeptide (TPR) repeat protein
MATLAGVLEQRSGFSESLVLRQELLRQFTQKPGYGLPEYARQLLEVGELQLRNGREAEAAATFDKAMASMTDLPEPVSEARMSWVQVNLLQGLRIDRTWTGSAVQAQAALTASSALRAHRWRTYQHELELGEVEWSKLRFKIQPWKGSAESGSAPAGGEVAAQGGLTDLWATPDPKPGLYLFSLYIPHHHAAAMRAAQWMFIAPWKLSLFPATLDQVQDEQKWKALLASSAAEKRSEPILSFVRFGVLNRGSGPSHRPDGYAVVATVAQSLPPGRYIVGLGMTHGFRVFHNGNLVTDAWTERRAIGPLMTVPGDSLNQIRVEAEFVRLKPDVLLPSMSSFTVEPLDGEARAMSTAEEGLRQMEETLDQLNADLARGISNARTFQDRGYTLARCGRFTEALEDFGKSIELDPSVNSPWYWRGCTLAYLGNADAYRANCLGMLERFATTSDWPILDRTVKSCLLLPSPEDPKRLAELTRRYLAEAKRTGNNVSYAELCQSMACYRLGDYAGSLESAQACEEELQPIMQVNAPGVNRIMTAAESLTAMAQEHLHRHDQSVAALRRARVLLDRLPKAGREDLGNFPEDWLICQTLFREAKAVVPVDNAAAAPATQPAAH